MKLIGHIIKRRREDLGLSQRDLGEQSGVGDAPSVSRIESGQRDMRVSELTKIARVLGVQSGDLIPKVPGAGQSNEYSNGYRDGWGALMLRIHNLDKGQAE